MSSLIEKKLVARLPLRMPAEAGIHPAWQMAAITLPSANASRTSFTIAGDRRIRSGAKPPGMTTASYSTAFACSAWMSTVTG